MEQNACRVAKDVAERINYEPGPAGDFIQSHLSPQKDEQFFFNTEHLRQFVSSAESKQKNVPGCAYFKNLSVFLQSHVQVGELYLEYLKEACQETSGTLCEFCTRFPRSIHDLKQVPRPMPDKEALPDLRYLAFDKTPTVSLKGSARKVDDFQPRAQIKKSFEEGTLALDNADSIATFSKTFAVEESLVRKYLEHMDYLNLKIVKRSEKKKKKKEDDTNNTYKDYDWVELFHSGELDKHHPVRHKMNKKQKVEMISAWLANNEFNRILQDTSGSDDDSSDDNDGDIDNDLDEVVLNEIGYSTDDEESDGQIYEPIGSHHISTRSGKAVTTHLTRRFYGDSD